jgi:hypothetical protein
VPGRTAGAGASCPPASRSPGRRCRAPRGRSRGAPSSRRFRSPMAWRV